MKRENRAERKELRGEFETEMKKIIVYTRASKPRRGVYDFE